MLSLGETSPKILCGFELPSTLNPNEPIGSGVVAFDGQLYLYDASTSPLVIGDEAIFHRGLYSGDYRTLSDQTVIPFSFENDITGVPSSAEFDVLRWPLTRENIEEAKTPFIGTRVVTRRNLVKSLAEVIPSQSQSGALFTDTLDDVITWASVNWVVQSIVSSDTNTNIRMSLTHNDAANLPNQFFTTFRAPTRTSTLTLVGTVFGASYSKTVTISTNQTAVLSFGRMGNSVVLTGVMIVDNE